jgi:medium-chain acyl-[acyl-carrier-protein] hydrolase
MKDSYGSPEEGESPWIGQRRPARVPRMRLIAFPYAGGGASVFRRWIGDLGHSEWLDFAVIQLPGRENRIAEPPYRDLTLLLNELQFALKPLISLPYVLFGYSMGALLAYEVALRLAASGRIPRHLIVAARTPPYRMSPRASTVRLSQEAIVEKVKRLGGAAPDLIESGLFQQHFLPTLQADFTLVDSFYRSYPQILPCDLLALGGSQDPEVSTEHTQAWAAATGRNFGVKMFEGGHFFLHGAHHGVISFVNQTLAKYGPDQVSN